MKDTVEFRSRVELEAWLSSCVFWGPYLIDVCDLWPHVILFERLLLGLPAREGQHHLGGVVLPFPRWEPKEKPLKEDDVGPQVTHIYEHMPARQEMKGRGWRRVEGGGGGGWRREEEEWRGGERDTMGFPRSHITSLESLTVLYSQFSLDRDWRRQGEEERGKGSTTWEGSHITSLESLTVLYSQFSLDRDWRRQGEEEGGFCIEAGHQCDSGEGMFSFLSLHGRQVCQAIARQCLTEQEAMEKSGGEGRGYGRVCQAIARQCLTEQEAMREVSCPSSPPVCDFYKVLLNTVHPSSPPVPPHHHHHEGEEGNLGARRLFRESREDLEDAGGDKQRLPASTETRDQIAPSPPEEGHGADAVYSLVCFSEGDPLAAPPLHLHHSGHSSATAPVKPPRWAMRLTTKGTEKTEKKTKTTAAAGAGPLGDRSPSGPQSKGAPLSFKQKLSKLISIDLAKLQFPHTDN
ncbi:hypothetical protein CRUP_034628 [Coryphaenoides rupestris]|nr:hypothetical protein CRUP_034628 [Coryphaenoides rupestris]